MNNPEGQRVMDKALLNQVLTDENIKKAMRDFVLRSSQFSQKQGQFNVFNFCSDRHKKKFHDQIIAFLLDPTESHGLGITPLHLFIDLLKQRNPNIDIQKDRFKVVTVEIPWGENPNIRISNNHNEHILIEDKIHWAIDQPTQLKRYYSAYQKKGEVRAMIYLSPHKHKQPDEQTFGSHKDEITKILVPLYAFPQSGKKNKGLDLCHGWLEPILKAHARTNENIDIITCISQYKLLLEQLGENYMNDAFSREVMSSLLNDDKETINKEKFEVVAAITNNKRFYPVPYVRDRIKKDIQNRLDNIDSELTIFEFSPQGIAIDFIKKAQPKKRYGIDIEEFSEYGKWWRIQVFVRDSDANSTLANPEELKSIRQKLPKEFRQIDDRLCYNGEAGLEYIGKENEFCEIVINALRTFDINSIKDAR